LAKDEKIFKDTARIKRERKTIDKMINLYCNINHGTQNILCADCQTLKDYAFQRLLNCPFHENKPVCANCSVHCYKQDMREKIKQVMRFSGPKIFFRHPYLSVLHLIDEKFR